MTENHVYSVSEIVGTSPNSIEDAMRTALARARRTVRNLDWFQLVETRGHLSGDGEIEHFQVTLKIGFRMED